MVPAQASRHAVMMSICDTSRASPPTIQYERAPAASITVVATIKAAGQQPHHAPFAGDRRVSCGSSA